MPWQEVSIMSQRKEFVMLARVEGTNIRELCRRFGISHVSGYKWLHRYQHQGDVGLADQPKKPHHSPRVTPQIVEEQILEARDAHPAWGARKIKKWLQMKGQHQLPSPSTITAILARHDRLKPDEETKHSPWHRFEQPAANDLWQMDFKGHFALAQGRCHPLTVLDDHSRFALGLRACANEQGETVKGCLTNIFRCYGLPYRMLMDNGSPWGDDIEHPYTPLTVWLLRLGIGVSHGHPYHPQTQGKDERFHRTLKAELLQGRSFTDIAHCQAAFDPWREVYNLERPHEALGMATPTSRYQVSWRSFPEVLPEIEYGPEDQVRLVQDKGRISFHGRQFNISKAFKGYPVALRPTLEDGVWDVYFVTHHISQIDLNYPNV